MSSYHSRIGPYQHHLKTLSEDGHSNLTFLTEFMEKQGMENPPTDFHTCTAITFDPDGSMHQCFRARPEDLASPKHSTQSVLYILEDLSTEWIESLGLNLDIEPQFFLAQLRAVEWEHYDKKTNPPMLPSIRHSMHFITLRYFEPLSLDCSLPVGRISLKGHNVFRRVRIRNPTLDSPDKKSIGVITRIASFWKKVHLNKTFEAVLLVDPRPHPKLALHYSRQRDNVGGVEWDPYGGGYTDFDGMSVHEAHNINNKPPRTSGIRHDLEWRIRHPSSRISSTILQRDFNSLHLEILDDNRAPTMAIRIALDDVMASRNLINSCCTWVERSLIELGVNPEDKHIYLTWKKPSATAEELLACDWAYLRWQLRTFRGDTEALINTQMTNLQIRDSKRVDYINKLGASFVLVYTPLSTAYGILSMGGDFAPGQKDFWVFWIVSLPLIALTIIALIFWQWSGDGLTHNLIRNRLDVEQSTQKPGRKRNLPEYSPKWRSWRSWCIIRDRNLVRGELKMSP